MRAIAVATGLAVLGLMCWRIAGALATDATGMAVGLVFGILAGIPAALLVLATSSRRREMERDEDERYERYHNGREHQLPAYPYQPPVIVGERVEYYDANEPSATIYRWTQERAGRQ